MNVLNNCTITIYHFLDDVFFSKCHVIFEIVLQDHFFAIFESFSVIFCMQVDNSNLERHTHQDEWFKDIFKRVGQHYEIVTQPSIFGEHLHHCLVTVMQIDCLIVYVVCCFQVVTSLHFCKWHTDFDCFANE